ncbi:uncharacterized protein LOC127586470 isoform X3 [Pristis pectinata]|uniref:uncharacterized protein LOC127586470 isoform X3 n=1 Tax=Pristis pectinata TaxID=685728 RepID=UPI00223E26C0|nr:uncharacterized protein LOC127586470 isoform X3 [Pristis pectinata]
MHGLKMATAGTEVPSWQQNIPKATRRLTLRSRVSVSAREEAQLDDLPKVQQPQSDALHCNTVTRSMSKKVEQTPSRTNQRGDRTSVSEDISPRRSPRIMGTQKSPAALRLKEKALCGTPLSQEDDVNGNSTLTENDEVPKLQLTETPAAKSEKEVQKPILRKSLRIAKLQNPNLSVNIDSNCLGEEHMDESREPAVVKQNEVRSPKKKGKTKAIEVGQENLEMAKVSSRSLRVAVSSPMPERETLSVEPKCNNELHGESNSGDAAGTESKPSYSDKEMQTVIWKIIIGAEEELKAHDPETKDGLLLQDATPSNVGGVASSSPVKVRDVDSGSPRKSGNAVSASSSPRKARNTTPSSPRKAVEAAGSHRKSRESAVKETSPIKTWNLRSKRGHVLLNNEEKVETEPLTTSVESLGEKVTDEQEIEKAEVKEADKIIEEANDHVAEIPEELGHKTKAKPVGKHKKTTKSGHQLIVSNLDSSKTFGELQIAVIRFFMEKQLSVTSIGIRKSRKRGRVTFLTRKDLIQALQSNGEELLGRTLQLRRPERIEKPLTPHHGKKRKLMELDQDSTVPCLTKKKKIQKLSVSNKKSRKYSAFLIRKRKSRVVSPKKSRRNSLTPIKKEKMIQAEEEEEPAIPALHKKKKKKKTQEEGEKKEWEEPFAPPSPQKKRKLEETILDEREDKAAVLQKKNKKKLGKAVSNEEREEEKEGAAPPPKKKKKHQEKGSFPQAVLNEEKEGKEEAAPQPKKKKKKNQENVALNGKREEEKVHAEPLKMEKKKHQSKTSWCLYLQNIGFQEKKSKIKAAIGNFLNERSISYKEIVLHPSRFSACIELHCEEDLNEALKLNARKIFGQAVRLNKVAKLGALDVEGRRTLYIRSLPSEVSARNLKKLFKKVAGVWIQENQKSSKRFALIAFKTTEAADGALSKSEIECKGNLIQLQSVHQRNKERKKILMVRHLPCPLSKMYLKALFTDAKDVRVPEENDSQAQGIAYIEYKTAKQAKAALTQFREKGIQGQAVRIDSIAGKNEWPEKNLLQEEKKKRGEKKIAEAKKKGNPEKKLPGEKKKSKKCKTDLSPPSNSLFVRNLPSKATLDGLKSTFKASIGAEIHSSKKQYT